MKYHALALLLLLACAPAWSQARAYKDFFAEGQQALADGDYQTALAKFNEAFRLEPKAGRFRSEGVFFVSYLPRHKIALAHEGLGNVREAETWANRSKEALEEDELRKDDDKAAYFADIQRIQDAADQFRQELNNRYTQKLRQADTLLAQNKLDEALTAFRSLAEIDPSRPDSAAGVQRVTNARSTFLKNQVLNAKTAILDKDFAAAENYIAQIARLDNSYESLPQLRADLQKARQAAEAAKAVATTDPPPDTARETVASNDPPPASQDRPVQRDTTRADTAAEQARLARLAAEQQKASVRTTLLNSLKPYRRGDPAAALKALAALDPTVANDYSSYHWLKAVYHLTRYHTAPEPRQEDLQHAREHLATVAQQLPNFQPDPSLYPDYVLEAYAAGR